MWPLPTRMLGLTSRRGHTNIAPISRNSFRFSFRTWHLLPFRQHRKRNEVSALSLSASLTASLEPRRDDFGEKEGEVRINREHRPKSFSARLERYPLRNPAPRAALRPHPHRLSLPQTLTRMLHQGRQKVLYDPSLSGLNLHGNRHPCRQIHHLALHRHRCSFQPDP
jgi:hypothetical protein